MGAGHGHSHTGKAQAGPTKSRITRMSIALAVIGAFLILEATVALTINSLALLADAGHMLTDVVGLSMGLIALILARRGSSQAARTFGWHRAEVLTAMGNALLLFAVAIWVFYEAIERIGDPPAIPGAVLIITAAAGLAANVAVMALLRADSKDSLAVRGAYLEVLADAVGSVGVLVAGFLVLAFNWTYADVVVGVLISLWVVPRAVRLAAASLRILTQASPADIDVEKVNADLAAIPDVTGVHDLHVWTLTTGMDVATVHLTSDGDGSGVLERARGVLESHGLEHATVQIESTEHGRRCAQDVTW